MNTVVGVESASFVKSRLFSSERWVFNKTKQKWKIDYGVEF